MQQVGRTSSDAALLNIHLPSLVEAVDQFPSGLRRHIEGTPGHHLLDLQVLVQLSLLPLLLLCGRVGVQPPVLLVQLFRGQKPLRCFRLLVGPLFLGGLDNLWVRMQASGQSFKCLLVQAPRRCERRHGNAAAQAFEQIRLRAPEHSSSLRSLQVQSRFLFEQVFLGFRELGLQLADAVVHLRDQLLTALHAQSLHGLTKLAEEAAFRQVVE
mmetsp:Transcript_58517/g.167975  ORF Transcript_58517/g.167975 Transcript_58517/m.167975 type:complete len:212 (-) Transcript_58517:510-1145(-)